MKNQSEKEQFVKEQLESMFGKESNESMQAIVTCFEKLDYDVQQIVEHISDLHEIKRAGLHLTAITMGKKELADKIEAAIKLIEQKLIDEFKKSVEEKRHEEFLSKMSWKEKISLKVHMKLTRSCSSSETSLSPEEKMYLDIIENSINSDIEKEAFSQGFESVEAWREHNAKMYIHSTNF